MAQKTKKLEVDD